MEETTRSSVKYLYYRDNKQQPRIILARAIRPDGIVGYGWAILGAGDQFFSRDFMVEEDGIWKGRAGGLRIARGRAFCAIESTKRGVQIGDGIWRYKRPIRHKHALRTVEATMASSLLMLAWHDTWQGLPNDMWPPTKEHSNGVE